MAISLPQLIIDYNGALVASGASPFSPFTALMATNLANVLYSTLTNAVVDPGIAPDGFAAPSGGGPVVGFGKLK